MGIALGVNQSKAASMDELEGEFHQICERLSETRPTAVNLFWALDRMRRTAISARHLGPADLHDRLIIADMGTQVSKGAIPEPVVEYPRPYVDDVALNLWGQVAGWTPFVARAFSLLMGVLTIAVVYRLGCLMAGKTAGLGAAASRCSKSCKCRS
jgi:hypothetical protein